MYANLAAADPAMLTAVIDVAPTPLWVIGADGTVALANRAAAGLLGYPSVGDLIGAPSHDTLHEWYPDGSRYPAHSCPILEHPGSHATAAPEWFITRAGRVLPVTWSTRPLGTGGAKLLSFADATERLAAARTHRAGGGHVLRRAAEEHAAPNRAALRAALLARVRSRFRDPEFTATALAAESHLSLRAVQQLFAEDGRSPAAEIRRRRVEFACELLARGCSVQHAYRASGFADAGTFARAFRRRFGESPSEWARRHG